MSAMLIYPEADRCLPWMG